MHGLLRGPLQSAAGLEQCVIQLGKGASTLFQGAMRFVSIVIQRAVQDLGPIRAAPRHQRPCCAFTIASRASGEVSGCTPGGNAVTPHAGPGRGPAAGWRGAWGRRCRPVHPSRSGGERAVGGPGSSSSQAKPHPAQWQRVPRGPMARPLTLAAELRPSSVPIRCQVFFGVQAALPGVCAAGAWDGAGGLGCGCEAPCVPAAPGSHDRRGPHGRAGIIPSDKAPLVLPPPCRHLRRC